MPQQMIFFVSIAFSLIAWGIVTARYIYRAQAESVFQNDVSKSWSV
jgi:hypothetical protein